jgi:hypothetical protein
MDDLNSRHPGLRLHFLLLRIFALVSLAIALAVILGIGFAAWNLDRMSEPWKYVMMGVAGSGLLVLVIGWKAGRGLFVAQQEVLCRASQLLSLGVPVQKMMTLIRRRVGEKPPVIFVKLQPFDSPGNDKGQWVALNALNPTAPKESKMVDVYSDDCATEPLMVIRTAKRVFLGVPVVLSLFSDMMQSKKRQITLILTLAISLVMAVLIGELILTVDETQWELHSARASLTWPLVQGEVVSASVDETEISVGKRKVRGFESKVIYRYTVAGRGYRGSLLYFGYRPDTDPECTRRLVERYPPGARVNVFYEPGNPAAAVLETGHVRELEEQMERFKRTVLVLGLLLPVVLAIALGLSRLFIGMAMRRSLEVMRPDFEGSL